MKTLRRFVAQVRGLFGGERGEEDFDAEMESHVAMHVEDNVRAGMDASEARRQALLKLGGLEQARQARREGRTLVLVENLLQDLRFAARQLLKNKGFAITAILILSLGICANVAIFSFVDAALIKPLPYAQPSRLVGLNESTPMGPMFNLSYLDYLDWKRMNKSFSSLEAYTGGGLLRTTPEGPQPVNVGIVSDGFFHALGVTPVLGRDFRAGEDVESAPRVALLSNRTWQKEFGGRSDVLGQTVTLEGNPYEIIGVLPKGFLFQPIGDVDYWMTLHMSTTSDRGEHYLQGMGRLRDGVTLAAVRAEMQGIAGGIAKQYPDNDAGRGATVTPLTEVIVGNMRPILKTLFGGAALLLLIACVNVSSLLLVRSENRRREMAVRGALGASRGRLVRQFVTEGLLLVSMGAALGGVGALGLMQVLLRLIPENMRHNMSYLNGLEWNTHETVFLGLLVVMCLVLFSVTPMLRLPVGELQAGLNEGGRSSAGMAWRRLGANLVVVELCTAMVLLVGAGLLGKSFYRMMHGDLGMRPERLAAMRVQTSETGDLTHAQMTQTAREAVDVVRALPGVESAAISEGPPVASGSNGVTFKIVGRADHGYVNQSNIKTVSADFFHTVQAELVRGRYFTADEDESKPHVIVVNETFARKYFPGEDAVGKQIHWTDSQPPVTIVGVMRDIHEGQLDEAVRPSLYEDFAQDPHDQFFVIARAAGDPAMVLAPMESAVKRKVPHVLTESAETLMTRLETSQAVNLHRSSAWLVGGFAAVALLLGVVGIYGVIAYSVSQRTREIGVRMALGAQRSEVSGMILREAGWLVAAGVVLGVACSLVAGRLLGSLLFGVSAWDVPTLAGVAAVLSVAAMLASFLPAMRAARVDPVVALRAE